MSRRGRRWLRDILDYVYEGPAYRRWRCVGYPRTIRGAAEDFLIYQDHPLAWDVIRDLPDDPCDDGPGRSPRTDFLRRFAYTCGLAEGTGPDPSRDADREPGWIPNR